MQSSNAQERDSLFTDMFDKQTPSRVPIMFRIRVEAALEKFGYNIKRDFYSAQKCFEAADKMAELLDTDTVPVMPFHIDPPAVYRYTKHKFNVVGDDGFFQHPDFSPMEDSEYPLYIKNPAKFIVEKLHPRIFGLIGEDPALGAIRTKIARDAMAAEYIGMIPKIAIKNEKSSVYMPIDTSWAPLDFIADYIRSFSTILTDIRRHPEWVSEACDVTADYEILKLKSHGAKIPGKILSILYPLHMPPYMRPRDVEKIWLPSFKKVVQETQNEGFVADLFCEHDWGIYAEMVNDLPGNLFLRFESTDHKIITDKISQRHIIAQGFPGLVMRTGSVQECTNAAKATIDELGKNGNYVFGPSKEIIRGNDFITDNIQAVIKTVREYGKY